MGGVSELLVEEMIQVVQFIKPHTFFWAFERQVALVVKNPPAQERDATDKSFSPWVGNMPWRRKWEPTPVFLPGKFRDERSLVG